MNSVFPISEAPGFPQAPPSAAETARFSDDVDRLAASIADVVVTAESKVRLALAGLFSEGHILLEDLPGVGKTLMGKTIAQSIACDFKRIQFTPDLLPSDVTGTTIFDVQASRFEFVPGPVFSNVVLADELNRTGPRTQSALLEAMAEFQVSVDGEARPLPRPFFVIATQNLSESHGTFPLPDSQKDRFLISTGMGMPTADQEMKILERSQHGMPHAVPVITAARVVEMQDTVKSVEITRLVRQYIVNIARATRAHPVVRYGLSPRGGAALQRAAQCWAAFEGRPYVIPEDVSAVAAHVIPHRLMLNPGSDASAPATVTDILETVRVPA
ncbi:MAG: MoxR family ATPase [Dehalococcoidia bacterium]